jgi:NADPH2:quinone reductase
MKYRHIVIRQFGGPEVLQVVEDDLAVPGSGQALVKVLAADVGFSDVNIRRGRYPGAPRPPFTPGYAMVGVVEQLGPDTAGLQAGQRVAALTLYGSYSQYFVFPALMCASHSERRSSEDSSASRKAISAWRSNGTAAA